MKKKTNIQDQFINQCRKQNVPITVYTSNGFPIFGKVISYDDFTLFLEDKTGKKQLVYKSAISTITASKEIDMSFNKSEESQ